MPCPNLRKPGHRKDCLSEPLRGLFLTPLPPPWPWPFFAFPSSSGILSGYLAEDFAWHIPMGLPSKREEGTEIVSSPNFSRCLHSPKLLFVENCYGIAVLIPVELPQIPCSGKPPRSFDEGPCGRL